MWNPGDGSDTVEGQAGTDTMLFNGANIAEKIDLSANGGRLRFTRDVGNIAMDPTTSNTSNFTPSAAPTPSPSTTSPAPTSPTPPPNSKPPSAPEPATVNADTVTVNATDNADNITVTGSGTSATVTGLAPTVVINNAEFANDQLVINTGLGDDVVDDSGLAPNVIPLSRDAVRRRRRRTYETPASSPSLMSRSPLAAASATANAAALA